MMQLILRSEKTRWFATMPVLFALACLVGACDDKYANCGEAGETLDCSACSRPILQVVRDLPGEDSVCNERELVQVGCTVQREPREDSVTSPHVIQTLAVEQASGSLVEILNDGRGLWLAENRDLYCTDCVTCELVQADPCFEYWIPAYCDNAP